VLSELLVCAMLCASHPSKLRIFSDAFSVVSAFVPSFPVCPTFFMFELQFGWG
jgi:hypothetical protein